VCAKHTIRSGICRHSIDAFQPPLRVTDSQASNEVSPTSTDSTLPNIVRPSYNDLRSSDDAVDADNTNNDNEQPAASSQVNTAM